MDPKPKAIVYAADQRAIRYWQSRAFATLWITYARYYLGRVSFSVALPGIIEDFGYSKTQLGMAGTVFSSAYALGEFVIGRLGDRWGWNVAFYCWTNPAFVAAGLMAFLWTYKPPKSKYL